MALKDVLKKTGKIAGEAALVTGVIAVEGVKKAVEGGKMAKDYVQENYADYKHEVEEISRMTDHCKSIKAVIDFRQNYYESSFEKELDKYKELCNIALDKAKFIFQYHEYMNKNSSFVLYRANNSNGYSNNKTDVAQDRVDILQEAILSGGIAGIAAGAGVAGLTAAFGAASTGSAISSLSGAAFTNALLAKLGGGAIAAGGFGMTGGVVVLSAAVAVPAIAVTGIVVKKKTDELYNDVKQMEKKAEIELKKCESLFSEYDEALEFIRSLNNNLKLFIKLFSKMISQLRFVAHDQREELVENNEELIVSGVEILNDFLTVPLIEENGQPAYSYELAQQLEEEIIRYGNQYALYQSKMTRNEIGFTKQLEIIPMTDMEKDVEMVPVLTEEFNNAQKIAEEQITIDANDEPYEEEKTTDALKEKAPQLYNAYEEDIKTKFSAFEDYNVIKSLATGSFLYEIFLIVQRGDSAGVTQSYSKAIEIIIKDMASKKILKPSSEVEGKKNKITFGELYDIYVKNNVGILGRDFDNNFRKMIKPRNKITHERVSEIEEMEHIMNLVMRKSGAIIPTLHKKVKKFKNKKAS